MKSIKWSKVGESAFWIGWIIVGGFWSHAWTTPMFWIVALIYLALAPIVLSIPVERSKMLVLLRGLLFLGPLFLGLAAQSAGWNEYLLADAFVSVAAVRIISFFGKPKKGRDVL